MVDIFHGARHDRGLALDEPPVCGMDDDTRGEEGRGQTNCNHDLGLEDSMTRTKSAMAAAFFAVALVGGTAGTAFGGEVTGPPGTPNVPGSGSGVRTGAPAHSNSICSYNGLNDMNPDQGPIAIIVQTPHTQGSPGDAGHGTCAGGTNPENPPSP